MNKSKILVLILLLFGIISINAKVIFALNRLCVPEKYGEYKEYFLQPTAKFFKRIIETKGKDFFIEYFIKNWSQSKVIEIAIGKDGKIYHCLYKDSYPPVSKNLDEESFLVKEIKGILNDILNSNDTILVQSNYYYYYYPYVEIFLTNNSLLDSLPYKASEDEYENYLRDYMIITKEGVPSDYFTNDGESISLEKKDIGAVILQEGAIEWLFGKVLEEYNNKQESKNLPPYRRKYENGAWQMIDTTTANELYEIVLRKIDEILSIPTQTSIILPISYEDE